MSSASTPASASAARVETGYAVAMRRPARSAIACCGAATGNRGLERAPREAEVGEPHDVGLRLGDEVRAGDPEVDDPVLDVLGDVVRADEQKVDRRVPAGHVQRPLARLEAEARRGEELERGRRHPPFRGDGDEQAAFPAVLMRSYRVRRSASS